MTKTKTMMETMMETMTMSRTQTMEATERRGRAVTPARGSYAFSLWANLALSFATLGSITTRQ